MVEQLKTVLTWTIPTTGHKFGLQANTSQKTLAEWHIKNVCKADNWPPLPSTSNCIPSSELWAAFICEARKLSSGVAELSWLAMLVSM